MEREKLAAAFEELEKRYFVPDILTEQTVCLFLLESPHIQELKHGAPVSGASGATMTKHIFGQKYVKWPLGVIVKKNRDEQLNRPSLNKIGLMNVCQIPMQAMAYRDPDVHKKYGWFLAILEGLRVNNDKVAYSQPEWNAAQALILERLVSKLAGIREKECIVVPCGRFAQKFFRLAGVVGDRWQVIHGVPHPSYNSWDREQYRSVMESLKNALRRYQIPHPGREASAGFGPAKG
jgi:hypothetical protein